MDKSSWPELGETQNKSKVRGDEPPSSSFAGALKKQNINSSSLCNSVVASNSGDNTKEHKYNKEEYDKWKEDQKLKRQKIKDEKKLRKEEEFRRQIVAPKGYRVQLVPNNVITTPVSPSHTAKCIAPTPSTSSTLLDTAFPSLGSPVLPRSKIVVDTLVHEEEEEEQKKFSKSKKRKEPITINLRTMLKQLKIAKKEQNKRNAIKLKRNKTLGKKEEILSGNPLDSSQPVRFRGKFRENPRPKKPTALKSAILKHRQNKKINREQCENYVASLCENIRNLNITESNNNNATENKEICDNIELKEENKSDEKNQVISKTEVKEKVDSKLRNNFSNSDVIHSSKFRDYCDHMSDSTLNEAVQRLLRLLVSLQDRAHAKDPVKAKAKKKMLTGLHEARKAMILKKVVLLIIAPDLEKCPEPGGLDSKISELISLAKSNNIPYAFTLPRRKLGYVLLKKVPVSSVVIINIVGAESELEAVTSLIPALRERYKQVTSSNSTSSSETQVTAPEDAPDVNKIVVSSLLKTLEQSLQKPKLSPFLQAIESVEDND